MRFSTATQLRGLKQAHSAVDAKKGFVTAKKFTSTTLTSEVTAEAGLNSSSFPGGKAKTSRTAIMTINLLKMY